MTREPVRIAVVGAGPAADMLHLPVLARLRKKGAVTLRFICDLDERRARTAKRKYGFQMHGGDAQATVARDDVDAVYIFGSAQMHYEYGLRALEHGKHLFVEKPIAPGFAEAEALACIARARGLVAVGGHNRRFYKAFEAARAHAGRAGFRFGEAVAHKPEPGKPPPFGARTWLTANGIHALDALLFMMGGLPERVASFAGGGDPPATFSAAMRWKDGAQGVFLCDNRAGARREDYAFHAPGRSFRISDIAVMDGFEAEHIAFLDAIRSGAEPRHALVALAPSLFLAEKIEQGFHGELALTQAPKPMRRAATDAAILVTGTLQASLAPLSSYRLVGLSDVRDTPGACRQVRAAILGRGAEPLPDALLDKLPNLGAVGIAGLSIARHRPEALLGRNIAIFNASAAYAETVADFAFALAVLGRRRAFASDRVMRQGGWDTDLAAAGPKGLLRRSAKKMRPAFRAVRLESAMRDLWRKASPAQDTCLARDLKGATVGLVGWSANARAFAQRLTRSGASVAVWSEHAAEAELAGISRAALGEALAADIVSLHRGLTPATRHFLGAAELAQLRPGAVLINVARGALIEPWALLRRLQQGDIFACLDTFEDEPPRADDPLRRLPNVFLTSHIAGGTPEMHRAAAEEVVAKIAAWLGGEARAPVSATRLSTMT